MALTPYVRPVQTRPRGVHFVLRDGDTVDGGIYLTDGQALAPYLGSRKNGWVNIVDATWGLEGELHRHAVLQTEHIVLAASTNRDYPVVSTTQNAVPRAVDILLENGTRLQGNLLLGTKQRLSDYLAGTGVFLALLGASRVQDGDSLGDVAVNSGCVKAVRDAKVFAPEPGKPAAEPEWGGLRRGTRDDAKATPPVNRERVKRITGPIEVVTPGRSDDRRTTVAAPEQRRPVDAGASLARAASPATAEVALTPAQARRETVVGRNWLVRLASDAGLAPPDVRDLADSPSTQDLWQGIATRNDIMDVEIAVLVATKHQLDLAVFDEVTAEALAEVPAKVARRIGVLPVRVDGRQLTIAVCDPESHDIDQQLRFVSKLEIRRVIATPADIAGAIAWYYGEDPSAPN